MIKFQVLYSRFFWFFCATKLPFWGHTQKTQFIQKWKFTEKKKIIKYTFMDMGYLTLQNWPTWKLTCEMIYVECFCLNFVTVTNLTPCSIHVRFRCLPWSKITWNNKLSKYLCKILCWKVYLSFRHVARVETETHSSIKLLKITQDFKSIKCTVLPTPNHRHGWATLSENYSIVFLENIWCGYSMKSTDMAM